MLRYVLLLYNWLVPKITSRKIKKKKKKKKKGNNRQGSLTCAASNARYKTHAPEIRGKQSVSSFYQKLAATMEFGNNKLLVSQLGRLGLDSKKIIVGVDYGTTFTGIVF
jgi:hypothetical protein